MGEREKMLKHIEITDDKIIIVQKYVDMINNINKTSISVDTFLKDKILKEIEMIQKQENEQMLVSVKDTFRSLTPSTQAEFKTLLEDKAKQEKGE